MPRHFFDVHDGVDVRDEVGWELSGEQAAKAEAMRVAANYASTPKMFDRNGGALVVVARTIDDDVVARARLVLNLETQKTRTRRRG